MAGAGSGAGRLCGGQFGNACVLRRARRRARRSDPARREKCALRAAAMVFMLTLMVVRFGARGDRARCDWLAWPRWDHASAATPRRCSYLGDHARQHARGGVARSRRVCCRAAQSVAIGRVCRGSGTYVLTYSSINCKEIKAIEIILYRVYS